MDLEVQIFKRIGPHPHIVGFKVRKENGFMLERAIHVTMLQCLEGNPTATVQHRLTWMRQAAEAVAATHRMSVILCDISMHNLLVDRDLMVKFCDFQRQLLRPDGTIEKQGRSCKSTKSYMPREIKDYAHRKTDLFALGNVFYRIV